MNWFYNLKTAYKFVVGFGLCLTLAVLVGTVAITRMAQLNAISNNIISDQLASVEALSSIQAGVRQFHTEEYRCALSFTPAEAAQEETDLTAAQNDTDKALKAYQGVMTAPDDTKDFAALESVWENYVSTKDTLLTASRNNDTKQCAALLNGPLRQQFKQFTAQLNTITARNRRHGQEYQQQAQSAYASARATIVGLLVLAVVLGTCVAVVITRYITGTLGLVSERLNTLNNICVTNLNVAVTAMERGDLTVPIATGTVHLNLRSKDEFGQMARTFDTMLTTVQSTVASFRTSQASLCSVVGQLKVSALQVSGEADSLSSTSRQIGAATEEITATMQEVAQSSEQSARGANEVAQGSSTQAASISEGAELVKQLAEAVRSVARDSETAEQATEEATKVALTGVQTVRETVSGMHAIQRTIADSAQVIQTLGVSSKQIGTIVQTIEEIADQTNLLALNAAIEAARAGDAGRGFAVVADEVRKLAERSRGATEEIGGLIETVQSQTARAVSAMEGGVREVEARTALAERAGEALAEIQSVVASVSERVHSICAAAEEMSAASDEVSRSMSDVAAVVEESSAAAEEMSASAKQVSMSVASVAGTTQQQGAAVEDLVNSASVLSGMSASLMEMVTRFTVESGTADGARSGRETVVNLPLRKAA